MRFLALVALVGCGVETPPTTTRYVAQVVECPAPDGGWYEQDGGACPCYAMEVTCTSPACQALRDQGCEP